MDYRILMELATQLGSRLAVAGAETYRIEESIIRVLDAYGLESRVYSVPNSLFVTILVPGQLPITQLCRMNRIGTNLEAVERYSNLSRRICSKKPDPEVALQWLGETESTLKQYSTPLVYFGHFLVAGGLCVFAGGTAADCLCSGLCGLLICLMTILLDKLDSNTFFQKIALSFGMAMGAYALAALGLSDNVDTVVIGALMLLVPGILFTNAMRDIIFGDTNSGINRVVETMLIAAAIALGTAAAWNVSSHFWGEPILKPIPCYSVTVTCLASLAACIGFVFVFNIHGYGNMLCALGGVITWAAYCAVAALGGGSLLCFFIGTVVAAIFAETMARIRKYPAISYLIISLIPLIPGTSVYYMAREAVSGNMDGFVHYGTQALSIAGAMAVGILLVSTITRILHHHPIRPKATVR